MRRPQNWKKNLPLAMTKQLYLLSSVKTSGRFFQNFEAFSEKLNFIRGEKCETLTEQVD